MLREKDQQNGFILVQVLASLVILALLASSLLEVITTSSIWISKGAEKTRAIDYAGSIIETIRAHSFELSSLGLSDGMTYEVNDINLTDGFFAFALDPGNEAIKVEAPAKLKAALTIKLYDTNAYYVENMNQVMDNNLFQIDVVIKSEQPDVRIVQMLTVVAAR